MPITRPTGDQLLFSSSRTGDHTLDDYLESAEVGGKTLGQLMRSMFGELDGSLLQLVGVRRNPASSEIEARFGSFTDSDTGWVSSGAFLPRVMGAWAQNTVYRAADVVVVSGVASICSVTHTSGVAPTLSNFFELGGSGVGGGPSSPTGLVQTSTFDASANGKMVVQSGGFITVTPMAGEVAISILNTSLTSNLNIRQGSGVQLFRAGTSGTGNRDLAPKGIATVYYESSGVAIISGNLA